MYMKIRIEHTNNPLNYGTNMMVANLIYYLDKELGGENQFNIDVYNDCDLNIYKSQYPELKIYRETIDYNFFYSRNFIDKIKNKIKRDFLYDLFNKYNLDKLENSSEVLIILGGDDLSEYYGDEQLKRELNKLKYIKDKLNVFLVGQTIGPFSKKNEELVFEALNGVNIYTRDPWSKKYLEEELKLKNIKCSSDLALIELPNQKERIRNNNVLKKYNLKENEYITIVASGLYESYCKNKKQYVEVFKKSIEHIKDIYINKKIVFLPHVLRPSVIDDRNIISELEKCLDYSKQYVYIYEELSPMEARKILGNGVFTLTGRMHGAINTFQMRKPAISISYSVKYNGVIGQDLEMPDLIVHGEKDEDWYNGKVEKSIIEKVNYLKENYLELINRINKSLKKCEYNIDTMILEIANELKGSK
ncbi:TPA: hypothetical protein I9Z60_003147 [Clostridium perfringens]|nr:hypothetical protein [Clostridium perfringens]HAT4126728.1 hypothetical protein [Clostridium perfringens]